MAAARVENRSDTPENRVAGLVAELVVDALEVVEIDEHQRERVADSLGASPLERQLVIERPSVGEAGQAVGRGLRGDSAEVSERVQDRPCKHEHDEHKEGERAERCVEDAVLVGLDAGVDGLFRADGEKADSDCVRYA